MADFIPPTAIGQNWTDILSTSGLSGNYPLIAYNVGAEPVSFYIAASSPNQNYETLAPKIPPGEFILIPSGTQKCWMACVTQGYVHLQYAAAWAIEAAMRSYPELTQPKLQTAAISNAESFALLGILYRCVIEMDAMASNASQWVQFIAPDDKELAILTRQLSCETAGARYRLYTSSSGFQAGAALQAYNVSNRPAQQTNTATIRLLTAAPTTLGTNKGRIIHIGKGSGTGLGNAQAGTTSSEQGFTIYTAGTGFEGQFTNTCGAANDLTAVFEFAEVPNTIVA